MGEKIIFVEGERIGLIDDKGTRRFKSDYLVKYRQNLQSIKDRNTWKNEGAGAAFRGEGALINPNVQNETVIASINGLDFIDGAGSAVYSVSSSDFSGVYRKDLAEDGGAEGHVIHHANLDFSNLAYNPARKELAVSVKASGEGKHIALLGLSGGSLRTLTEGDSVDENPSWGIADSDRIYYDSCGIGRDMGGNIRGYGPCAVFCLDLGKREAGEVVSMERHDCILPKEDCSGNLYFIRKPHVDLANRPMTFIDLLTIPWKIGKGIFRFIEFFTHSYTGETFNTRGTNPAKSKQQDARQVFIHGNLVNVEKALKENTGRGEKYPGIAPANWQLMRKNRDGKIETVKKGVLDYALTKQGDIIYSNGRYIVRLNRDGKEEKIEKLDMATRIRVAN